MVISAGFAETGADGSSLQHELLEVCRASGMRLIGPNCMGVVNTDPEILLNGTFATTWPPAGRVAFLSQSGALGIAVMGQAAELGLGLSTFVSVGNKADISGNDLLSYWDEDPSTDVVLLYLESFGNPRRFAKLARRIGKRKPIVAVKSGRSAAGQSRGDVAHRGAARRFGRHRGRALPPERRDPHRHARGDVRRRDAPGGPAGAGRATASPSSRTRVASGSCAPTRAKRTGSTFRS